MAKDENGNQWTNRRQQSQVSSGMFGIMQRLLEREDVRSDEEEDEEFAENGKTSVEMSASDSDDTCGHFQSTLDLLDQKFQTELEAYGLEWEDLEDVDLRKSQYSRSSTPPPDISATFEDYSNISNTSSLATMSRAHGIGNPYPWLPELSREDEFVGTAIVPHWWGVEDSDLTREVFARYATASDISPTAPPSSSLPNTQHRGAFIGKVLRVIIIPSAPTGQLMSLDKLFVYNYDCVPFGKPMTPLQQIWMVTTWDVLSGVQLQQIRVPSSLVHQVWKPRAISGLAVGLFCEPDASNPSSFIYSSALANHRSFLHPVGYHKDGFALGRFFRHKQSR